MDARYSIEVVVVEVEVVVVVEEVVCKGMQGKTPGRLLLWMSGVMKALIDIKVITNKSGIYLNDNPVFPLKCVGPFSVGRKKRSPLFLNSNQVR